MDTDGRQRYNIGLTRVTEKKEEEKKGDNSSPLLAESPTPDELPPAEPGVVWFRGAPIQWF